MSITSLKHTILAILMVTGVLLTNSATVSATSTSEIPPSECSIVDSSSPCYNPCADNETYNGSTCVPPVEVCPDVNNPECGNGETPPVEPTPGGNGNGGGNGGVGGVVAPPVPPASPTIPTPAKPAILGVATQAPAIIPATGLVNDIVGIGLSLAVLTYITTLRLQRPAQQA